MSLFVHRDYSSDALSHIIESPNNCIHDIFCRHALNQPNAIALSWSSKKMTYSELNKASDVAAMSLIERGVKKGAYVPILTPRGPELVIAALGVLKVGAAYSLLDPNWPLTKLMEIIDSLSPPLLITKDINFYGTEYMTWYPSVDSSYKQLRFTPPLIKNDSTCCLFFTSGTTGKPKGVLSPHCATIRLFQNGGFTEFSSHTIMPLSASLSWDAFSLELWGPLLNGGACWIVTEPYLTADTLRNGIKYHQVNTVWMTSSLFNMVVEEDLEAFDGLQQIMTGGERLSVSHVKQFLQRYASIKLINGYGPVENTIFTTTHPIQLSDCEYPNGIPVGKPVPGTDIYILKNKQFCEENEKGEICITGKGLAQGYLNDSSHTRNKFIEININGTLTKAYCTGDLGFWSNGVLHFSGRQDRQVKIRGHRIELNELEQQIVSLLPSIRSCRLISRKNASRLTQEIIAFCIPAEKGDPLSAAISQLQAKLASYELPAAVVSVSSFPITAQGKLDESALLKLITNPKRKSLPIESSSQTKDTLKELIAKAICEVLGRNDVRYDVPLIEFGATSLDMGRISAHIAKKLSTPVPVSWIYKGPTIQSLTEIIKNNLFQIQENLKNKNEIPLNSMQLVYLARYLINPSDLSAHCLMVWEIEGDIDRIALQAAIDYVHRRHEGLRASYLSEFTPLARLTDISSPQIEILYKQNSKEEALKKLRNNLSKPLDPTKGNLWRCTLIPYNKGRKALFGVVVHHITFDGWSEMILANDLSQGYNSYCDTKTSFSTAPPSLAEIYSEQAAITNSTYLQECVKRISEELKGSPELAWPLPEIKSVTAEYVDILVPFDKDVIKIIDTYTQKVSSTRFETLFALWAQALSSLTGQKDFCIGTPVRQRFVPSVESALGCYINTICIRLRENELRGGLDSVKKISQLIRRAFEMQEVPLEAILEKINPPRTGRPPLFQTLFALQDSPIPSLSLKGLKTKFLRQSYFGIPLELHAEVWPDVNNNLTLSVSYQSDKVSKDFVLNLIKNFMILLSDQKNVNNL